MNALHWAYICWENYLRTWNLWIVCTLKVIAKNRRLVWCPSKIPVHQDYREVVLGLFKPLWWVLIKLKFEFPLRRDVSVLVKCLFLPHVEVAKNAKQIVKHVRHHCEEIVAIHISILTEKDGWICHVSLNIFAGLQQFVDKNNGHFGTLHRQYRLSQLLNYLD